MKAGACLIASARHHFQIMTELISHKANAGFSLCLHAYRQDATNGWRKVCALELDSAYVANVSDEEAPFLSWEHFSRVKRLADLVPVGDESGVGCVGITLRSLASLGCPSWRELANTQSEECKPLGCRSTCCTYLRSKAEQDCSCLQRHSSNSRRV